VRLKDLDHLLRAAGDVTGHARFVLVGSNAILAWSQAVPEAMAISREADLFASDVSVEEAERLSDLLENIGQLSEFDETHGYYADGVSPDTAVLPLDWRTRSKVYSSPSTNGVVAVVPHPDDIALSKLCRGEEKDLDWVDAAHAAGLIDLDQMVARAGGLPQRTSTDRDRLFRLIEGVRHRGVRP